MKTNRPTFRSDEYADDSPDISAQKPFKGSDPYRHVAVAYSPGEEVIPIGVRVGRNQLEKYNEELSTRDREILASLKVQVSAYRTDSASTYNQCIYAKGCPASCRQRASQAERLWSCKYARAKDWWHSCRIRFSDWHLTEAGERFLAMGSSEQYSRRRYLEPSRMFLRHSLAVSECYVQLVEICRRTRG